jgi:hypothetical protein
MDAIKKKMQAMKLEKDNAMDRALLCEQQARDANLRAEKVNVPRTTHWRCVCSVNEGTQCLIGNLTQLSVCIP